MASTYSSLKIELIGTGEQSGTWGNTTNTNLGTAIEEAIVGYATANFTSDADLTISLTDTNATQTARNLVLNLTSSGSLSTTRNLIVPTIEKPYYIFNNTTGGQSIVVKTSAGTGVTVPNGRKVQVYADGTNVVPIIDSIPVSATVTYRLPLTDGTNGQLLQTNGSGVLSFVSGASLATPLAVVGNATAGAEIRLPEDTDNGSNYVALKAPNTLASDLTFTLPSADGTNGQVLQTNGSGVLSFIGAGDATANIGYLNIPQNSQSAAYTLVLADSGKHILHPSADTTARTFTIPANSSVAFPIGTAITFINQNGAGVITIAITTDTMRLAGAGTTGSRTLAANGIATAIKVTSTEWIISGTGLT